MPTVTMPQLGESVAEGTIGKWLKQVGDHVDKNEPIVEVITDKVNAEVPSPFEGILTRIIAQEGETVPNNADIAVVEAVGTAVGTRPASGPPASAPAASGRAASAPAASALGGSAPVPAATALIAASDGRTAVGIPVVSSSIDGSAAAVSAAASASVDAYAGRMTPAVRRLAREHGVDLSLVRGTGHSGRITREDVLGYVASGAAPGTGARPAAAPAQAAATAQPAAPAPRPATALAEGDSLKPASAMRKAIAAQMTRSLAVPTAYITIEVDMSAVVRRRESAKRDYQAREGIGLSYVAFVTKAVVEALRLHPDLNGHWTDEGLWRRKALNVGIAVAVDDGLVVPVIKNADSLSLHGLNRAIHDLAERARTNHLRLEDIQGGTFTVDNTGWTGSILTLPIINVPEVAILTMEAIVKRPVVVESAAGDSIAIRSQMNMCLGIDHRATDGAQGGRFLGDIRRWLETVSDQTSIW